MKNSETNHQKFRVCPDCLGRGKKSRRLSKKIRLQFQFDLEAFKKSNYKGHPPIKPKASKFKCEKCAGSGLIHAENFLEADVENFPEIAIIGGGIGGVALAVACLHRGIPFTLYEWDKSFDQRSQGYGLTLQQAGKVINAFGINDLKNGIRSTRHLVHTSEGEIVGEWGARDWLQSNGITADKQSNIHIARQSLRQALLDQLGNARVNWDHQLIGISQPLEGKSSLNFAVNGNIITEKADIIIGADGIRSRVRQYLDPANKFPLRYLDCMVILGICSLEDISDSDHQLLDSKTVFQTANGVDRIYMMPYDSNTIMWQLSFPVAEEDAVILSKKGADALKKEALLRTDWHDPIPDIIKSTPLENISGYPVYDRELLRPDFFEEAKNISLIGDAAHPMSPFKGQGANQALIDALTLGRLIYKKCRTNNWREDNFRDLVLNEFEADMIARTAPKVKDSATAADVLHSAQVLIKKNAPRGKQSPE